MTSTNFRFRSANACGLRGREVRPSTTTSGERRRSLMRRWIKEVFTFDHLKEALMHPQGPEVENIVGQNRSWNIWRKNQRRRPQSAADLSHDDVITTRTAAARTRPRPCSSEGEPSGPPPPASQRSHRPSGFTHLRKRSCWCQLKVKIKEVYGDGK